MPNPAAMRFDAVLFDCDGVLVDSEPITMRVLRDMLAERGWDMPLRECMTRFVGKTVRSQQALIETHTVRPLTEAWMDTFYARRNAALTTELQAVPGAHALVRVAQAATQDRIACASGADRAKIELQLQKTGLHQAFAGRIFSGHELPRSKPAPDVYLAAAAHLGVEPSRCLVIEDTPTGVAAGMAAGATVWGYAPAGADRTALQAAGAIQLFDSMPQMAQGLLGACL